MLAHCRRDQRGLVSAALREVFNAEDRDQARERVGHVLERLAPVAPKVCRLLEDAEEDLIAFYLLPARALDQAAIHQPARARQQRDRPPLRRRRHLPQRRLRDPPRRRAALRTERRVARPTPLPLRRVNGPDPRRSTVRGELTHSTTSREEAARSQRGLSRQRPNNDELGALHHLRRLDSDRQSAKARGELVTPWEAVNLRGAIYRCARAPPATPVGGRTHANPK